MSNEGLKVQKGIIQMLPPLKQLCSKMYTKSVLRREMEFANENKYFFFMLEQGVQQQ